MSEELRPCPFCGGTKICTEKGINLNYCDNCSAESNVEHWNNRPIEDAQNARIAELEAERRWIPVSERLPEGDAVLVYRERGKSNIDIDWTFIEGGREYWYNSGLDNVTHWMPLPEPPEVENV